MGPSVFQVQIADLGGALLEDFADAGFGKELFLLGDVLLLDGVDLLELGLVRVGAVIGPASGGAGAAATGPPCQPEDIAEPVLDRGAGQHQPISGPEFPDAEAHE